MEELHVSLATLNVPLYTHWRSAWGGLTVPRRLLSRVVGTCICVSHWGTRQVMHVGAWPMRVEFGVGRCGAEQNNYLCGLLNVDSMHVKVT